MRCHQIINPHSLMPFFHCHQSIHPSVHNPCLASYLTSNLASNQPRLQPCFFFNKFPRFLALLSARRSACSGVAWRGVAWSGVEWSGTAELGFHHRPLCVSVIALGNRSPIFLRCRNTRQPFPISGVPSLTVSNNKWRPHLGQQWRLLHLAYFPKLEFLLGVKFGFITNII